MLKRVSIQNFKSLKDVTLDLQKVNLLIGPNNSGKTNFLKALEDGERYLLKKGDFNHENFSFKKEDVQDSEIRFVFENEFAEATSEQFEHIIIARQVHEKSEEGFWIKKKFPIMASFALHSNSVKAGADFEREIEIDSVPVEALQYYTGHIVIYKPDPNKLKKPSVVGIGAQSVNADVSNLIAFFDFIRDDQPDAFARIRADLQKCVPEFTEINFQSIPSNEELVKQFGPGTYKRIGLTDGRQGVKYWADELSEGTLYFLALLCIINQPNPPKLLLLEEPEKGIHPRRLFEVIQFILTLAEEKDVQVIMTTHSPMVVDMFKDMPESVFIFDKDEEGATHVKNLQRDIIEPETARSKQLGIEPPHYTDSLGDAWTVGFLGGVPK